MANHFKKILLTTVGAQISPDLLQAINENNDFVLIGCDPYPDVCGRYFVDKFYTVPSNITTPLEFIEKLVEIVNSEGIDIIIPASDEDHFVIAENIQKFNHSVKILINSLDKITDALDKKRLYKILHGINRETAPKFSVVKTYYEFMTAIEKLGYPDDNIVVKPPKGRGGRGVYFLTDKFDFNSTFNNKPRNYMPIEFFKKIFDESEFIEELIVMEELKDPFYSVYSLCDNGETIISLTHVREWGSASQTFRGRVYYDKKMETIAAQVNKMFGASFLNNMEFATAKDGRIVLFDYNMRIAASSGVDRHLGCNFPLLAIKMLLGKRIDIDIRKIQSQKPRKFMRYYNQVWSNGN